MSTLGSPHLGGDQNKAPMLRAVLSSELAVATIVVALRFFTRLKLTRSPGTDDWAMLATHILAVTSTSMDLAGLTLGIGRHVYYLSHYDAVFATKLDWLCQAFAISSVIMGKISVAFLILRLSIVKWHYYFLHTINVTLLLFTIPMVILDYAQCRPAALLWDPTLPGICQDSKMQGSFALFLGSYGAATDLLYALFPILIIWPLQMPRKRKLRLAGIMCLGTFSAAAAAIKTYYLQQLRSRADFTYDTTSLMIWFTTEMYIIIIAGSLPTLRPFFQKSLAVYHSFKHRSSKGTHESPHELQFLPRPKGRSSDQDMITTDIQGIIKSVDFVITDNTGSEAEKRWDNWEDEYLGGRTLTEDERV